MSLPGRKLREARSPEELLAHLLSRTEADENGCLRWTGYAKPDGYPRVRYKKISYVGARLVYTLSRGPIPEGHTIDHLCHTRDTQCLAGNECTHRRCLNPEHLEAVTAVENTRRTANRTTVCKRGHVFTDATTYIVPGRGNRRCRACMTETRRQRRAKARGLVQGQAA